MSSEQPVQHETTQRVAHIRLNRPEVANTFDLLTTAAFADVIRQVASNDSISAVLISGAGRRFCAGGDVTSFAAAADQPSYIHRLAVDLDAAFQSLARLEKPVVAAVQGAVAGAGLALMLSCDLVVAHPSTKFAFAYPGIGFTPDCGLSYLLPRAMGQQRALRFALLGEPASAQEALAWGLIAEESDEPSARAHEIAATLASGPATALGQTRRLLRSAWDLDRAATGSEEARTITEMVKGKEAQALIARFVARP
jgi:2-(1,2-epoxy-1,2-dihydrophenyl)acetyl-CoA isomerase